MGGRGPHGLGKAARLHGDDRLGPGEGAGSAQELARIGHGLHVEDDAPRLPVHAEVVDQVSEVDVDHGPDGHKMAEPDPIVDGPLHDGSAECPRLREKGNASVQGHPGAEARVKLQGRDDQSEAVGPDDADTVGFCPAEQLLLQLLSLLPDFPESGSGDDHAEDSRPAALLDHVGDRCGGGGHHNEVHRPGQFPDGREGPDALDRVAPRVHGVHGTLETRASEVSEQGVPDAVRIVARPDDGNRFRIEYFLEVPDAHGVLPVRCLDCCMPRSFRPSGRKAASAATRRRRRSPVRRKAVPILPPGRMAHIGGGTRRLAGRLFPGSARLAGEKAGCASRSRPANSTDKREPLVKRPRQAGVRPTIGIGRRFRCWEPSVHFLSFPSVAFRPSSPPGFQLIRLRTRKDGWFRLRRACGVSHGTETIRRRLPPVRGKL